jgi:hypothetical protein
MTNSAARPLDRSEYGLGFIVIVQKVGDIAFRALAG